MKKNKIKISVSDRTLKLIFFSLCFILIGSAVVVLLFTGISSISNLTSSDKLSKRKISERLLFKMPEPSSVVFDGFLIPIENNSKGKLISLKVLIKLPNIKIWGEVNNMKFYLRGIIYDELKLQMERTADLPPLEELEARLSRKINEILSEGKIVSLDILDIKSI